MADNEFRRADMVKLLDERVIIHPRDFSDAVTGWREYREYQEAVVIDGEILYRLLRFIGIQPVVYRETNPQTGLTWANELQASEFVVRLAMLDVGRGYTPVRSEQGQRIEELWARVGGPQQLEIRVVFAWEGEQGIETETRVVVYHGRFSVWWSDVGNDAA